jgi:hypothetical protein
MPTSSASSSTRSIAAGAAGGEMGGLALTGTGRRLGVVAMVMGFAWMRATPARQMIEFPDFPPASPHVPPGIGKTG